jgi:hypothetical protein
MVYEAATSMCQTSLFSTTMMAHPDFSPAAIFKMAATMYGLGNSMVAKALKVEIQAEEAVESQEDTVQGLLLAATSVMSVYRGDGARYRHHKGGVVSQTPLR